MRYWDNSCSKSFFRWASLVLVILLIMPVGSKGEPQSQKVSMRFVHTELATVIAALAAQVDFDVVIGPGIDGLIDLNLTNVEWRVALDAIAAARGLTYHWTDGVLVVLNGDDTGGGKLAHQIVKLKYAGPEAVKTALANVLSSRGKIEILGSAGAGKTEGAPAMAPVLVVSDVPYRLPAVIAMIDSLDVLVPQIEIAVKFVETDINDQLSRGFRWPTRVTATISGSGPFNAGSESKTNNYMTTPSAARYNIADRGEWNFGTLSFDQLTGFLEFLSQNGESRLLSDPRVTVLENETATMRVTTNFPVQTLNRFSEGGIIQDIVDYEDLEVGITLSVTPRLNDSGTVTLDVEPIVEEITGYTGPPDNQRPITARRTVKTSVRVGHNQTIVIGGLVREAKFTTKTGIFLLKDIPLLGSIFSHTKVETKKTDLLIFITPRILEDFADR